MKVQGLTLCHNVVLYVHGEASILTFLIFSFHSNGLYRPSRGHFCLNSKAPFKNVLNAGFGSI